VGTLVGSLIGFLVVSVFVRLLDSASIVGAPVVGLIVGILAVGALRCWRIHCKRNKIK